MSRNDKSVEVKATDLKWKKVDVPDTLDDFDGFYGLEELDGVNVKVVDGKVTFTVSEQATGETEQDQSTAAIPNDDAEVDSSDELIEFKNFDDIKEGELSVASSDSEEGDEVSDDAGADADADELTSNVFNANVNFSEVEVELPDWQALGDFSMTTLQGLSKLGYTKPTEIQSKTIPLALEGHDIMGKASTGSGKTLAYGIPILENLIKGKDSARPVALIFTPTRELASQVTSHLTNLGESIFTGRNKFAIMSLTGGLSIQKQERVLKYDGSGQIIIATPGRFLELLEKRSDLVARFAQIETLVLDEADRLLQDGHFDEFTKILKLLSQARREKEGKRSHWQTLIFSATFSLDLFNKLASNGQGHTLKESDNELEEVLKQLMTKIHFKERPTIIDANPFDKVNMQVKEALIECAPLERDLYVYYFISMFPGTTLIFCNAIDSVKKLTSFLNFLRIPSFQIHSSMSQKNRLSNLEKYEKKAQFNKTLHKPTVLIASDVAARGLDIPGIQHVIHYHLPRTADVYIHRSGRTARGQSEGVSVMICSPQEAMGPLRKLRKVLSSGSESQRRQKRGRGLKWQKDVSLLPIEVDIVRQLKGRSQLAAELANHDVSSTSLNKDENWLKKAADDLGIDVDSDDEKKDVYLAKNRNRKLNKTLGKDEYKMRKLELNSMLDQPVRKDMRKKYLTGGLTNLADELVKKRGHGSIIGQSDTDALETLKRRKGKK
ncbi:ATP-dependent RNA helicase KNAG_0K01980 [Huiozyma naganishii CBS 8797]|uniref:RNA helicase n=1 Tax=Huiozyma naganishii (strain ATCC MYA-139 / BCRC 22969 / CBS 8797 / KCTC 17520 / NBRC 10181 / NCYC 3082 / Yp74L-3) TaxID=1071383 RepID=J7S3E6_HUIN7|nr:hypothetical protein KNAG_0K01980 [Kazachstania naganishii CBS 8797]CCK72562.1 hypothetical protein KNAG_0K01980 [Kazachstania naganishii CBS 8797]